MLSKALLASIMTGIADTNAKLNPSSGSENKLILFKNNITPTEDTVIGDLTEATFDGYEALGISADANPYGFDPLSGERVITHNPLLDPFIFKAASDPVASETIYGWAVVNHGKTELIYCGKLAVPVEITKADDMVDVREDVEIRFPFDFGSL